MIHLRGGKWLSSLQNHLTLLAKSWRMSLGWPSFGASRLRKSEGVYKGARPKNPSQKLFGFSPLKMRESRESTVTFRVIFWSLLIAKQIQIGQYGQGFLRLNFQRIIRNCVVNMKSHDSHLILEHLRGVTYAFWFRSCQKYFNEP